MFDVALMRHATSLAAFHDMEFKLFGSWGHAHLFNKVIDADLLALWEDEMQVTLPEDYRAYLTQLGNGGAGPAYGLSEFSFTSNPCVSETCLYSDTQAETFNDVAKQWYEQEQHTDKELYQRYFEEHPNAPKLEYGDWDQQIFGPILDKRMHQLFSQGMLFIANQGCSNDVFLILNGSHRGWCHITSSDYDYSYPLWTATFTRPQETHPISWDEYKNTVFAFDKYMQRYINAIMDTVEQQTAEQRARFHVERQNVAEFEQAFQEHDYAAMQRMLRALHGKELSMKTRTYYVHRSSDLMEQFPNDHSYADLYEDIITVPGKRYQFNLVHLSKETDKDASDYFSPTFKQFLATFFTPPQD